MVVWGNGFILLMMVVCVVGYVDYRRKLFCLVLILLGLFIFWRVEKNELKIKIISFIWFYLRFMVVVFKGNWKKLIAEFIFVLFFVF